MGNACGKIEKGSATASSGSGKNADAELHISHNLVVDNPNKITSVYKMSTGEKLGEGSYGSVCKATEIKGSGAVRAVKTISKAGVKNMEKFMLEIHLMKLMDHPNIIKLFETFQDSRNIYLVMEVCEGGELFSRILDAGSFNERDAASIVKQILNATYYLHNNNIAHRDLKPENFLFTKKGKPLQESTLKIIDFGLSCCTPITLKLTKSDLDIVKFRSSEYHHKKVVVFLSNNAKFEHYNRWQVHSVDDTSLDKFTHSVYDDFNKNLAKLTTKHDKFSVVLRHSEGTLTTKAGTPYYVAPEVLNGKHDQQCDVWSAGVIMYILLCGYPPFYGDTDAAILKRVTRGTYQYDPAEWDAVSKDAKNLIDMMLQVDPKERLTSKQALDHIWIAKQAPAAKDVYLHGNFVQKLRAFRAVNKLKKVALFAIAQNINDKQVDEMRDVFKKLDEDGDGQLSFEEINKGLSQAGIEVTDEVKELMKCIDSDNSGKIDYTEFIAATLSKKQFIREDMCSAAFRIFDANGDGKISKAELAEVLKSRGLLDEFGEQTIQGILQDVDQDGDGEISYDEFLIMMKGKAIE
eukprot:GEMP01002788.1.p1 GENE.GEMP01002788.1~~GEMP01002788.1.p1  ORF type:complete len:602 (+),score=113.76 GEMP01002788.1:79-1806(+)